MPDLVTLDRDLRGRAIESRMKETRSQEINGDGRFCGHRFVLKTRLYGDKRCVYCGRWFHWTEADCLRAIREGYVDTMNRDNLSEPLHCGSEHCTEYHHLCHLDGERRAELEDQRYQRLFSRLKRMKLVG